MSKEPENAPHVIRASKATPWKLVAGAVAAAAVLGGGYYAWKHSAPTQPNSELAYNEASPSDHAAPLLRQDATSETEAANEDAASVASTERQTAPATPVRRRTTARAPDTVPEEVVGVTRVNATMQEDNDIIVQGARRPVWTRTPSARRLSALYPARALERGREGEASVHCTVQINGALECVPVSETPANAGFGSAAIRVAHTFRHAQQRADGTDATGSPVNLRVLFRMGDEDRRG